MFSTQTVEKDAGQADASKGCSGAAKVLRAVVTRGPNKGTVMTPHRGRTGVFLVSKGSNLRSDAVEIADESTLSFWVSQGYGVRMSAKGIAPSLFMPKSIEVPIEFRLPTGRTHAALGC